MREASSMLIAGIIVIALMVSIGYGSYRVKRWFNWKFGYENKTEEIARSKVNEAMDYHIRHYHNGEIK